MEKFLRQNVFCEEGHYICDNCHAKDAIKVIKNFAKKTEHTDPFEIANQIMGHPNFSMYGPEHHVLTPVAILTALRNSGIKKPSGNSITEKDIKEAIRRASKIPGGWCGFYGSCGSGMGSGVAISVFTDANPSTDKERTFANEITSRSLARIADNLEHCCKRSVKLSIREAILFLEEKFGIALNCEPRSCKFSEANKKCAGSKCPFY